jgi:hypothetical protein
MNFYFEPIIYIENILSEGSILGATVIISVDLDRFSDIIEI